jgi:hypothetical protein
MLSLIQDKVLDGREFSSHIDITHTSLRLDQGPPEMQNPVVSTTLSSARDRTLFKTVPVLYTPDFTGNTTVPDPRVVYMDVFDLEGMEGNDTWDLYIDQIIGTLDINHYRLVFSFQLDTFPEQSTLSF